jgi:phage portal protein BeeE
MPSMVEQVRTRRASMVKWNARPHREDSKALTFPRYWSDGAEVSLIPLGMVTGKEDIPVDFQAMTEGVLKRNGPIFACIAARMRIFTQARFQFQQFNSDSSGTRPGKLFGDESLSILEQPWPNAWTGTLLGYMELDGSLAGNFYATLVADQGPNRRPLVGRQARGKAGARIVRLRPDWVTIIIESRTGNPDAIDARVVAYLFHPPGPVENWVTLLPEEVCHFAPLPDPVARFRGMSWLSPVIEEIRGDQAAIAHKNAFFRNGATPSLAVKLAGRYESDAFKKWVAQFREVNEGARNAYKSIFLAGGADVTPLTVDLKQLDFAVVQAKGETRIATASGVHPTLLGLSEGLAGSSLNAGNFNAARRLTVDMTIRHGWSMAAASLQTLVPPPAKLTRLTYDDRDIPFLHEDIKDRAEAFDVLVQAVTKLSDSGWDPDAAVAAITAFDMGLLRGKHTGLRSVQLQPPNETPSGSTMNGQSPNGGSSASMADVARAMNGNGASNGR